MVGVGIRGQVVSGCRWPRLELTVFLTEALTAGGMAHFQPPSSQRGSGDPRYSRSGDRRYNFSRRVRNGDYRMFTARAASRATVAKEMRAWIIMRIFAQEDRTGESVGENAVLVLKARNR